MKIFRYHLNGNWFKGNTHAHSTVSDGRLNFQELADLYAGAGYHFLFRTDHWVASNVAADTQAYPLLWLDGVELDGNDNHGTYFHVVCLGSFKGIERGIGLENALQAVRAQGGLLILAHPYWTANRVEDALRLPFDGVEVYNNVCQSMTGKGYAGPIWDSMLEEKPGLLAIASDDTHMQEDDPAWNGGWVVVNAAELSQKAIFNALRTGNFYASTGPEFYNIEYHHGRVFVRTSPVKYIRLVGPGYRCHQVVDLRKSGLVEAELEVPEDWGAVYLQIEDAVHGIAWTNPLFIESP